MYMFVSLWLYTRCHYYALHCRYICSCRLQVCNYVCLYVQRDRHRWNIQLLLALARHQYRNLWNAIINDCRIFQRTGFVRKGSLIEKIHVLLFDLNEIILICSVLLLSLFLLLETNDYLLQDLLASNFKMKIHYNESFVHRQNLINKF